MQRPIVIDFESKGIEARPDYPPEPVGVAVLADNEAKYYAWGHPTVNGIFLIRRGKLKRAPEDGTIHPRTAAENALRWAWDSGRDLLFQNGKFDLDIAEVFFKLPLPHWSRVWDTLFELFLKNPHAQSLSLKPSAEYYLDMPPEERDAVRDWLVKHGVIAENASDDEYGKNIWRAPGDVVGKYAIGDLIRTLALHELLYPEFDEGMRRAYDRDRELMPILLANEREGMDVDVEGLHRDIGIYTVALEQVEDWLRKKLKSPGLNLNDDRGVGDALFSQGIVTEWVWTKGGKGRPPQRSVAKDNMTRDRFDRVEIFDGLYYRNSLETVLANSMRPWYNQAKATGIIQTSWNQVRQSHGKEMKGVRTGRLSCSRFMNISKKWKGYHHPEIKGLPVLPLVRKYILPGKGRIWLHRDYKQQEFKWAAHFEQADLLEAYLKDPFLDQHDNMQAKLLAIGKDVDRDTAKTINLALLYKLGNAALSAKLDNLPLDKTRDLRAAVKAAMPGINDVDKMVTEMAQRGEPVRTWGGRLLYAKPPGIAKKGPRKGELVDYSYTLFNHLIQGSSADNTKEALIRYHKARGSSRLLVTVHDEINISAPVKDADREDKILQETMESIECDVKLVTDPKRGPSWGTLTELT